MNLLVFNLAMDAGHPVLGHAQVWVNELARRCEHVSVITMTKGRVATEPNVEVHSLGKELGRSEPRRLIEFYRLVHRVLGARKIDACFAHMAPLFSVLFAPLARRHSIPVLLWYAHGHVSGTLRAAHAIADRCVTPTPSGFRIASDKLFVVGHGVDTTVFQAPEATDDTYNTTALSIGRLAPIKRIDEILHSTAILARERGVDVRLRLVGSPLTPADQEYEAELHDRCRRLGIQSLVSFEGAVAFEAIPSWYRTGSVFPHLSATGSLDKVILEAMASGCVPVSRNTAFQEVARRHDLQWLVPEAGPEALADSIQLVLERAGGNGSDIRARLRRIVEEEHSLASLMDRLMGHLGDLATTRG